MDTKNGLTAPEAICELFPAPERDPAPCFAGRSYDPSWYLPNFLEMLRAGVWHGVGFRVPVDPSARRERVRSDLWDILDIDLGSNAASGGGLEYEGLRFFETKPEAMKTKKAENQCREWLVGVMKAERRKVEWQLLEEAGQEIPGLSDKAFKRAWKFAKDQPTTHESWQTRGPIPSL